MKKTKREIPDFFDEKVSQQPLKYSIKQWHLDDRPREKLLKKGKNALSDAELLAIIIGSGNKEESALQLAQRILASVKGSWNHLSNLSVAQLCKFKGIGQAKAISIVAALEMGKRRQAERPRDRISFNDSEKTFIYLESFLSHLDHEEFWVIYLDQALQEIQRKMIGKGGISTTSVDIRIILRFALECGATDILLAHNHPSGKVKPSNADKALTAKIKKASQLLNIRIVDHIIVGEAQYYSFSDEGEL